MLPYQSNESKDSSHFFITTKAESLHLLSFQKIEEEELFFDDDFLQDSVKQMSIARLSEEREMYCVSLSKTIKSIFDNILFKEDNILIYISIPEGSCKEKLIDRFMNEDQNNEFYGYSVNAGGYVFYFFFNDQKTSSINCLNSIAKYFKNNYNIDLQINFKN